jgi:hypothetical protein
MRMHVLLKPVKVVRVRKGRYHIKDSGSLLLAEDSSSGGQQLQGRRGLSCLLLDLEYFDSLSHH